MNMVFTAGCFFILPCIFLMDISVADPLIDVSPSQINLGTTSTLDINCTFSLDNHPGMAAVISLFLSRANATGQNFEDLAAVTEFSPNTVNLLSQEKVTATGVHSQTGKTFLRLTWQYPTALQGGVYKCSAHGVDNMGYNVEMTNISAVTVNEANLNDIFVKLQQLEMHDASMEQQILALENDKLSMEQQIQILENYSQTLEVEKLSMGQRILNLENYTQTLKNQKLTMDQRILNLENYTQTLKNQKLSMGQRIFSLENYTKTLENEKQAIEQNIHTLENDKISMQNSIQRLEENMLHPGNIAEICKTVSDFTFLGMYQNTSSYYYLSSYAFTDINESMNVCKSLGGQLAVVNDQSELTAIQNYLTYTSGISRVYISGSDEKTEGNWVLSDSDTPLPFTSWDSGRPDTNRRFNCLMLRSSTSWTSMHDNYCHLDLYYDSYRFMCEI